ncbi:MAG: hypothetical protein QOF12_1150, partial [Solirubrobacteraceae bacterium]|nr:hypothetical protein [Solirubrobacteraceae bacterium]
RLGVGTGPIVAGIAHKRPYKNLAVLVRALSELADEDAWLVLPGEPTAYEDELRALGAQLGLAGDVRLPGWLSDEDLEGLYALARCFVLPSFQEGFGLPVLEAMARGVPVACSAIPALTEVAGPAALAFDPADVRSIAAAVQRVLVDDREVARLVAAGHERCALFTWERTADLTLQSYRRALG